MKQELKDAILEIIDVVQLVPEKLQDRCFELLLLDAISKQNGVPKKPEEVAPAAEEEIEAPPTPTPTNGGKAVVAQDIALTDIHVKARKFLEKQDLSIEDINGLFYKDGDALKPLYEDLKTTKTSESQMRIGLLLALENAMGSGEFVFSGEQVREECQKRKCYDPTNFAVNFKNNAKLFDSFEKYDKASPSVRLAEAGRVQLAALVKELQ